jgi:hypothetical protein
VLLPAPVATAAVMEICTCAAAAVAVSVVGAEPSADRVDTTINARLDMMWQLALDAWAFTGQPLPSYERSQTPGIVTRKADAESSASDRAE